MCGGEVSLSGNAVKVRHGIPTPFPSHRPKSLLRGNILQKEELPEFVKNSE